MPLLLEAALLFPSIELNPLLIVSCQPSCPKQGLATVRSRHAGLLSCPVDVGAVTQRYSN